MATGKTSLSVSIETRDRLMALGKKGETYEEIIRKLLDAWGEKDKQDKWVGDDLDG